MTENDIKSRLFALRDEKYRDFQTKLVPTVKPERMIGVRLPALRTLAKELSREPSTALYLARLPHEFYDEDMLHALILNEEKDFGLLMEKLRAFLPCVDNWAVCDTIKPKLFKKRRAELLPAIPEMLASPHEYTVRFGLGMLMANYLDDDFSKEVLELAASVSREEYYIRMMQAWFFATALAKRYEETLPFIEEGRLSPEVLAMTKRKCTDSFRISPERKARIAELCNKRVLK